MVPIRYILFKLRQLNAFSLNSSVLYICDCFNINLSLPHTYLSNELVFKDDIIRKVVVCKVLSPSIGQEKTGS